MKPTRVHVHIIWKSILINRCHSRSFVRNPRQTLDRLANLEYFSTNNLQPPRLWSLAGTSKRLVPRCQKCLNFWFAWGKLTLYGNTFKVNKSNFSYFEKIKFLEMQRWGALLYWKVIFSRGGPPLLYCKLIISRGGHPFFIGSWCFKRWAPLSSWWFPEVGPPFAL